MANEEREHHALWAVGELSAVVEGVVDAVVAVVAEVAEVAEVDEWDGEDVAVAVVVVLQ